MENSELKPNILDQLRSIESHMRDIQRMVDEDRYCVDILNQTSAIHGALEKVDVMILENQLETCVTTAIRGGDPSERERGIQELLLLFQPGPGSRRGRQPQMANPGCAMGIARELPALSDRRKACGQKLTVER